MYQCHSRSHRSSRITDFAMTKLNNNYQQARYYYIKSSRDGLAQAFVPNGTTYIINLIDRECSCGEFQEFHIPCRHVVAIYFSQHHDPYDYIHEWYSIEYYHNTYI
jgi:predicted nucleic acid-binding Zn finger protein